MTPPAVPDDQIYQKRDYIAYLLIGRWCRWSSLSCNIVRFTSTYNISLSQLYNNVYKGQRRNYFDLVRNTFMQLSLFDDKKSLNTIGYCK